MGSGSPWCCCRLSCLCLLLWKTARGRVFPFGRRLQPHEGYMCSETLSLFLSNVLDLRCLDLNHFSQKTINTKCAILDLVSRGNKALHLFKPKRLKSTLYFRPMTKLKFKWVSGLLALNQHGGNGDEACIAYLLRYTFVTLVSSPPGWVAPARERLAPVHTCCILRTLVVFAVISDCKTETNGPM